MWIGSGLKGSNDVNSEWSTVRLKRNPGMKLCTQRNRVVLSALLLVAAAAAFAQTPDPSDEEIKVYMANLPFSMPLLKTPVFPANALCIVDFGAVPDGETMNTKAINSAIRACSGKGGGTVVVPAGMWLTGPIEMANNTRLHVEAGAVVVFSPRFEDYPVPARGSKVTAPIHGRGLTNVGITGPGMFNGNGHHWRPVKKEKMTERQWKELIASGGVITPDGKMWWPSKEAMNGDAYLKNLRATKKNPTQEEIAGAREFLRPNMVDLTQCKNVLIDGPTFTNTPGWCLHPNDCENVIIRNTKVTNNWWGQNTDAADINGCVNVLFYRNILDVGDDAICMKSGVNKKREFALQNVVIADCIVYKAHGGFVIGSNTDGGMKNISVKNCTFIGTDIGLRFKSARDRGGNVENIFVDGVRMKDIATSAILFDMYYEGNNDNDLSKTRLPHFRHFDIKNIVCDDAVDAVFVRGLPDAPIESVKMENVSISSKRAMTLESVDGFTLKNIRLNFKTGPVLFANNSTNIELEGILTASAPELFVKAKGDRTSNIRVLKADVSKAKRDHELAPEVKAGAIVVQ